MRHRHCLLLITIGLWACADGASPGATPSTANIEITAAALDLVGVDFVCYDVLVENGATVPETVVGLGDPLVDLPADTETLCSTDYGNGAGGGITYVAPCDASEPAHTVTIWVDGLYTGTTASPVAVDFQDPCPSGCALPVTCEANADTTVEYNLAVLRPASQGFFDVAVSFSNVFCSAKVDCQYDTGPIELLFDPATGERAQTAVLALACTSGATAVASPEDTVLFRNPITVVCGDNATVLDPSLGLGNIYPAVIPDPDPNDAVWQYAVYTGNETLPCGAGSCNKRFWNVAVGFDPTAANCTLSSGATAALPTTMPANTTPSGSAYPVIDINVDLTGPTGGLICDQHPLSGGATGVESRYTAVDAPELFCHRMGDGFSSVCSGPTLTIIGARTTGDPGRWSDGSVADSCDDYLNPGPGYRVYAGSTGDGVYTIDSDGAGGAAAYDVYCDMTTDGGGWTRLESALYPFIFSDTAGATFWEDTNAADPTNDNFSALARRNDAGFVDNGCVTMRLQVGDGSDPFGAPLSFMAWEQCHDAFTSATNGSDFTYLAGSQSAAATSTACGGFVGLHNSWTRAFGRTDEVAAGADLNCWRMQVVPNQLYPDEPGQYLDGFIGTNHDWQALWYR